MRPISATVPGGLEARLGSHHELAAVRSALIAEFAGKLPAGTVIRQLARAREQLLADGVRAGLAPAAEAMARIQLWTLIPAHVTC